MAVTREQEKKFTASSDQTLHELARTDQIGRFPRLSIKDGVQVDTYLDAEDGLLRRGGSLRVRRRDGAYQVTFKHDDSGSLDDRVQLEAKVDRAELELIKAGKSEVAPVQAARRLTGQGSFDPVMRAMNHRHQLGFGVAELALDRVSFQGDGQIAAHLEVEIEKVGQTDHYQQIAELISSLPGLSPSTESKYQLGRRLLTGVVDIPRHPLAEGLAVTINQAEALLAEKPDRNLLLRLAGGSASGKTSKVGEVLARHFGERATLISCDNYYTGEPTNNWDDPWAVELTRALRNIRDWKAGEPSQMPIYGFEKGRLGYEAVYPRPLIIFEGIFALHPMFNHLADLSVFVDTAVHGMSIRRLMRDVVGGRTSQSFRNALGYMLNTVLPMHQIHVEPTRNNADLIIENHYDPSRESGRAGLRKHQVKYRAGGLSDEEIVERRAMRVGQGRQEDTYYAPRGQDFVQTGERLRVRWEGDSAVLTYEGPETGDLPGNPRIDIPVGDQEIEALEQEYQPVVSINKLRRIYYLGGVLISLDQVDGLGKFVELRVGDPADLDKIEQCARVLGLRPEAQLKESYFELASKKQ